MYRISTLYSRTMKRAGYLVAVLAVFAFAAREQAKRRERPPPVFLAAPVVEARAVTDAAPLYERRDASTGLTPAVHAASAVELEDGRILAVWYGGSREGAQDVAIPLRGVRRGSLGPGAHRYDEGGHGTRASPLHQEARQPCLGPRPRWPIVGFST